MKKNKRGVYKTRIVLGHDPVTGKSIGKWITAHTLKEMEQKKDEIRKAYITGASTQAADTLVTDAVDDYIRTKSNVVGEASIILMNTVNNMYIKPAMANKRIKAVKRSDIQSMLNCMEGKNITYMKTVMRIFKAVFSIAYDDGVIPIDPTSHITLPAHKETAVKRALTADERSKIEEACVNNVPLAILYYTGIRTGELRALSWADIDLTENVIHINKTCLRRADSFSNGKTKSAVRDVPIVPQLRAILRKNHGLPNVRLFPCSQSYGTAEIKRMFERIGISGISAHTLRHNFVTLCWERGVDVMVTSRVVGHSNPSITMGIYTHLDKQHGKVIAKQLENLFDVAK